MKKIKCISCNKNMVARHIVEGVCKRCRSKSVISSHLIFVVNKKNGESANRTCPNCKIEKNENRFGKRGGRESRWYNSWCKECRREYSRKYRQRNKEKVAIYQRQYKERKKEKLKLYMREYRKRN